MTNTLSAILLQRLKDSVRYIYRPRFNLRDQIFLAKRLSFLTKAGIPLIEAVTMLQGQTRSKTKAAMLGRIGTDLAGGHYLATCLVRTQDVFGDFGINLIRVGESSGILTQNLTYLADELGKRHLLRTKVLSALLYPAFITVATLGITSMLTVYIFPKIMPIFVSLHVPLPLTTRMLIGVSNYLRSWGLLTLFVVIILGIGCTIIRNRLEIIRYVTDTALLHLPFAAPIARSYNLANFCRTLGLMLNSGVPVASAVTITAETTPNRVYRVQYHRLAEHVTRGEPLARSLASAPDLFPDTLTHMIAVGETSGSLAQSLTYLAELYELEVEEGTKNLSSSIEPILMLVMGLLVGIIAVSVITPIYEITQHLSPR